LAQDIYAAAVSIAYQLFTRRSDKYPVLPRPTIYPAVVLNGLSRYLWAPSILRCLYTVFQETVKIVFVISLSNFY